MDVQNDQWFIRIVMARPDSFQWKIYTSWLGRLNRQGPSKHLICAALFVFNTFTPLNIYGNVCKQKQIYLKIKQRLKII